MMVLMEALSVLKQVYLMFCTSLCGNISDAKLYDIKIKLIFRHFFLKFHHRLKSECISSKNLLRITLDPGSMSCENEMDATKNITDFLDQLFPDTRLEIHALPLCPVSLICKAPPMSFGHPILY